MKYRPGVSREIATNAHQLNFGLLSGFPYSPLNGCKVDIYF